MPLQLPYSVSSLSLHALSFVQLQQLLLQGLLYKPQLKLNIFHTSVCILFVFLGHVQLTVHVSSHHLQLLLVQELVLHAAALVHSLDPPTQGLTGLAHLPHRLWNKQGALNYLPELLQLFVCETVTVKEF